MKNTLLRLAAVLLIVNFTAYSQPTIHKPDFRRSHTRLDSIEHDIISPCESSVKKYLPFYPKQSLLQKNDALKGEIVVELTQGWKDTGWTNYGIDTLRYDSAGHLISDFALWGYADLGTWINYYLSIYTYDINGHEINFLCQSWNGPGWSPWFRDTLTNDSNGHLLTDLFQEWNDSIWANSQLYSQTYDANGLATAGLHQSWDGIAWSYGWREMFAYDTHGNRINIVQQNWIDSNWVNVERISQTFDTNGLRLSKLYQAYSDTGLVNDEMFNYISNRSGQPLSIYEQSWNNNSWLTWFHDSLTYNENGKLIERLELYWQDSVWVGQTRYLDSYLLTHVKEVQLLPNQFSLSNNYPNPFNNSTQISYTLANASNITLKVYDMLGREIAILVQNRQEPGEHSVVWNADRVSSGVYFYRLSAGGFISTKSMILMK